MIEPWRKSLRLKLRIQLDVITENPMCRQLESQTLQILCHPTFEFPLSPKYATSTEAPVEEDKIPKSS